MKHLKTKLMMSVVSLMLATIMMTSASFAWFTISTAPEISNVTTKMTANNNLEIMLDNNYAAGADGADNAARTLDPTTGAAEATAGTNELRNVYWGNLVDVDTFFKATDGYLSKLLLRPVLATPTGGVITFAAPTFAQDGRIDGKRDLKAVTVTGKPAGVKAYQFQTGDGTAVTDNGLYCYCYSIDFWLRTNAASGTKVTLGAAAVRGGEFSETGLGSWITTNKVTVKISDGTALHDVKLTAGSASDVGEGKFVMAFDGEDGITLAANTAKKITVYVYMDGANFTNADFATTATDVAMNIQFVSADITAANAAPIIETAAKYGRGYTAS